MTVTLRDVTPADEPFLVALYATTRADELALVPWSDEEKQAFVDMQYRAQHADYTARFPDAKHQVVMVGPTPAGRIWVDRRPDEIRLLDIAMHSGHRSQGVGTVLLERLQAEARAARVPLRHSVEKHNDAAVRFYRRLGFQVVEDWGVHDLMEWTTDASASEA